MTLLDTIDKIRELRAEADKSLKRDRYDPCGHTAAIAKEIRDEADALEADMERRIGWVR